MSFLNPFGLNFLESFQPVFIFVTIFLLIYVIWKIGLGTLRTAFIHFAIGTALIADSEIILILHPHFTFGIQIWWHLMFFLGMLSFAWGGIRLKQTSYNAMAGSYTKLDLFVSAVLISLAVGFVFASVSSINSLLEMILSGSIIEAYGLHHFFITTLAVVTAIYIATLEKTWRKLLRINIYPIIIFIFLVCVQHFLEIVVHANMSLGERIDAISELIVIVAFFVFDYGLV